MQNHLSIGLWNIKWASRRSKNGAFFVQRLAGLAGDVLCVTEGHTDIFPAGGHVITSEADYGYPIFPGRRKVLLWSLNPWRNVDAIGSPSLPSGRFVAGTTDTPLGTVRFIGVCIPWSSAHVSSGQRNRKLWEDHLTYLRHLGPLLSSGAPGSAAVPPLPVVLLGDFNQRVPRARQPKNVFAKLSSTVMSSGFRLATAGDIAGAPGPSIDHLAVNAALDPVQTEFISHIDTNGAAMSDHFGLRIMLKCKD